jgi:hypothetical protein
MSFLCIADELLALEGCNEMAQNNVAHSILLFRCVIRSKETVDIRK